MREVIERKEWLGFIPKEWGYIPGRFVFKPRNSKGNETEVLLAATQKQGMYPQHLLEGVVQVREGTDLQSFRTVHKNDYVISLRSFQGGFEMSGYEGVCSPAYQVFFNSKPIDHRYYKYLFKCQGFIQEMDSVTVGIREGKNIPYDSFARTYIPYPDLSEQSRIAAFLDERCAKIDEAVARHKALIEKLDEYWWAVIRQTLTKGLDANVSMKKSGIDWMGMIPAHWQRTKVKYFGSFINGFAFKPEDWSDDGLPIIRIQDLSGSNDSPNHTTREVPSKYLVKNGDILISWAATLDTFIWAKGDALLNQHIFKAEPKAGVDKYFFYWMMKNAMIQMRTGNRHGIMMEHVTLPIFENFELPLPNYDEQVQIGKYLNNKCYAILAAKKLHNNLIVKLEEYKKSLIYNAVTGKIEC